ncbi:MAG: TOBE domain-containing protein [Campylobacterota bacterium]|nr:TOBE domain-containing protein [Campylobacterota bacterium]
MEITSKLTLEMLGQPFLLEKRIELLHAIDEHGSISKAAKAVPMSYKSAWEAVDMMNSLSPEPIVCRETGGKHGGGTTITLYGLRLLENYAVLKAEHQRFLERLSKVTDIQNGTFKTMGRLAIEISARNQLQAEILSIDVENVNAKIVLKLKSGKRVTSVITREAVEDLQMKNAQTVTAIFKSNTVFLALREDEKCDENSVEGIVRSIAFDDESAKVVVNIGNHDTIVSVLPLEVVKKLELVIGSSVIAMINAKDIMLGK